MWQICAVMKKWLSLSHRRSRHRNLPKGRSDPFLPPSRTIPTMRRALVALTLAPLLALPACLSGFSEIRIVRSDAATADAAHVDIPTPTDAPQSPMDALDAPAVPDVPSPPMDAPEVAVPADVVMGLDAQDAPGEVPIDAGQLVDRADVVTATDAVDAFDVQCPIPLCNGRCVDTSTDTANCGRCGNSCGSGDECVGGQCGRWEFRAAVTLSGVFGSAETLEERLGQRCQVSGAGVEPCPNDRRLVAAAAAASDGGCGRILTREVIQFRVNLFGLACWTCGPEPTPIDGGCTLRDPFPVACCVFERR